MRLDVKKYLFVGYRDSLEHFFEKAQKSALVHFIDSRRLKVKEIPSDIQDVIGAIKIIKEEPQLKQEEPEDPKEADHLVQAIHALKAAIDRLIEEQRILKLELDRIRIFGQFSLSDIKMIEKDSNLRIQFFLAKQNVREEQKPEDGLIYVDSEHGLDYFVAINKESVQYENKVEMRFEHEYDSLNFRIAAISAEIQIAENELKIYSKYDLFLHQYVTQKFNAYHLETAKNFSQEEIDGKLFVVEGWVPAHKIFKLQTSVEECDVKILEIAIEEGEVIPTYLENKGGARIGEDLVHVYDTPSNTDKDPSLWVLFSFALFFAMIINDAGYGLVFLMAALYFRYKKPKLLGAGLRVWKLSIMLCSFCVVWGVLTNSFFGVNLEPGSSFRKFSVVHFLVEKKAAYHFAKKDAIYEEWAEKYPESRMAEDSETFLAGAKRETSGVITNDMITKFSDGILMELALLAGVIHITLSFLRYIKRNWAGAGWILAIWGCYFYFPLMLHATSLFHYAFGLDKEVMARIGLQFIYVGLGTAVVLGLIRNRLLGLLEITNVIQIFADILSYLRLYALGLAGAIISATLNDIAGSLNFLTGVFLLIIGHGLNMILAIVGGIIHGLRLNFIEWYHYSFEGGGKMFDPLRKIEPEGVKENEF